MENKVLMIIAPHLFRDEEYQIPRDVFEKNNLIVEVASSTMGECKGKFDLTVDPDKELKEVNVREYAAIVFVGGPGCKNYWDDRQCHALAKDAASLGKIVSAICSAPIILANAGLLMGKKATCFPEDSKLLQEKGGVYNGANVEVDGIFITADGPDSAGSFAEEIVKTING